MTTGRFFGLLIFALLMAGVGYGASYFYQFPIANKDMSTGREEVELTTLPVTEIATQGRLEPAEGTIAVSALPGEEIVELRVHEGQDVQAGDELAILGSRKIREAEQRLATAQQQQAEAQLRSELQLSELRVEAAHLAQLQAEIRQKELPPEELVRVTQERRNLAAEQVNRLQELRDDPATRDAITDAELQQQRLLIQQLDAEMIQNANQLEAATQIQQLAVDAAELEIQIAQSAHKGIRAADPSEVLTQTAELAKLTSEAVSVRALKNGKVLEIYARQGERIANTPLLLMADLQQMICVAEVHEASLKELDIREEDGRLVPARKYSVTIKSVALSKELEGEVLEVGRLIGAPKLRDPNPLARSDRRTAQVKIGLVGDSNEIARRFVHLQVNVTIHLK